MDVGYLMRTNYKGFAEVRRRIALKLMTLGEIPGLEKIWRGKECIGAYISLYIRHCCCFSLIMFSGSRSSLGSLKFSPVT